MCTCPRLDGCRLHTDAVNAGKSCSASPNFSSDKGCTWYSRLARDCLSSERANAPICDGAMVSGPRFCNTYCRPILALPHKDPAMVFSVFAPPHPIDKAQLQMILQIFADARSEKRRVGNGC